MGREWRGETAAAMMHRERKGKVGVVKLVLYYSLRGNSSTKGRGRGMGGEKRERDSIDTQQQQPAHSGATVKEVNFITKNEIAMQ